MSTWTDKQGRRHVGIMVNGQRVHRILPPGATAGDAKRLEGELRSALGRQRAPAIPGDPPMAEVMALYLDHAEHLRSPGTARYHALRIGQWLVKYRASQARQAAAHITADMAGHYAPATINRSLGALKKALRLAWERGLTPDDYSAHVKRLPEHNARHTWLTLEEVKSVADLCSPAAQAAIWISVLTGCRRGEALGLRPAMIGADVITLPAGATKTNRTRTIPIIAPLRPWLAKIGPDGLGMNYEGLKSAWRRAREQLGRPDLQFRDLRRSTGTLLIQSGVPLHHVQQILGHTSPVVTARVYAHLAGAQLAGSMGALEKLHQQITQTGPDGATPRKRKTP
jgi:integrase